jgi:hypothetical protein
VMGAWFHIYMILAVCVLTVACPPLGIVFALIYIWYVCKES